MTLRHFLKNGTLQIGFAIQSRTWPTSAKAVAFSVHAGRCKDSGKGYDGQTSDSHDRINQINQTASVLFKDNLSRRDIGHKFGIMFDID